MSVSSATSPWPQELVFKKGEKRLAINFSGGQRFDIPFELLRVESPSAEVQGHSAADKKIVVGKADVAIVSAEAVGRYAVKLVFDDGHNSGIYTWDWLYRLGRDRDQLLADYHLAMQGR